VISTSVTPPRAVLLGQPNTGKTTLFNRLCGLRSHVANYPGITADARIGRWQPGDTTIELVDLPGVYSLDLDLPESTLCRRFLNGKLGEAKPDVLLIFLDASKLARTLRLYAQATRLEIPICCVLTMADSALQQGSSIDIEVLEELLGVPVVSIDGRRRSSLGPVSLAVESATVPSRTPPDDPRDWSRATADSAVIVTDPEARATVTRRTDRIDQFVTHPLWGTLTFLTVMSALFLTIFWLASWPMDWIDALFSVASSVIEGALDAGPLRSLITDGVVGGVGSTVVFVPQIALLFFLLSLLEETGYLARAALLADRFMRPFGLPGHAFVPLLSSHACAIPAILCSRLIPDRQDRLATILVAPFLSCSARLPVYVLLISLLFAGQPLLAGLAFTGCYLLGAIAALLSSLLVRKTILRGPSRPFVMELPPYQRPSIGHALEVAGERSWTFLRKAGTVILLICIALWWLSSYPINAPSAEVQSLRNQVAAASTVDEKTAIEKRANRLQAREQVAASFCGRAGHWAEPILEPVGADWQLSVAILSSFAAREVFVSSLNVVLGAGDDSGAVGSIARVRNSVRDDGSALLTPSSAGGLLVFYVLAMQCLPTLAVTRRETGGLRWALLQLGYMTALAWALGAATRTLLIALGWP